MYVYTYIIYIHIAFHTRKNDMAVLYYESHGKFHHDLRYTSVSLKADQGLQLMYMGYLVHWMTTANPILQVSLTGEVE